MSGASAKTLYALTLVKRGFSPKDALRMAEEDMELRRTRSEGFVTIGQAANSVLAKAVRNG